MNHRAMASTSKLHASHETREARANPDRGGLSIETATPNETSIVPGARIRLFQRSRAFTLTELLVIMALIALLAALSLAAISGAKKSARNVVCCSNLKQYGLALAQFVNDVHSYPLHFNPGLEGNRLWLAAIFKERMPLDYPRNSQERDKGVFHCPALGSRPTDVSKNRGYFSYGYNRMGIVDPRDSSWWGLGGQGAVASGLSPVPEAMVLAPARMLAVGDGLVGWDGLINDGSLSLDRTKPPYPASESTLRVAKRHNGKANAVFCDGHVSSLSLEALFMKRDAGSLSLWNRDNKEHLERMALR